MPAPLPLTLRNVVVERRDSDGERLRILDVPALDFAPGESIGVGGHSGAGKSTLIEVIAGLTQPTRGEVDWGDVQVSRLNEARRDAWRRVNVGIIFQDFHLIPELSVEQNVLLPQRFGRFRLEAAVVARAREMMRMTGLTDIRRVAGLLSRGEQQRVAIARALLHAPPLILADEPTASLDAATGRQVVDLIVVEARRLGATLVVVSHDSELLSRMNRRLEFVAGQVRVGAP